MEPRASFWGNNHELDNRVLKQVTIDDAAMADGVFLC